MEYLTSAECAEKWNISQRRVAVYCKEGRISGAVMRGRMWMIPLDAKKPEDPRKTQRGKGRTEEL
ncbi:MAG: helix-turn-helix domain-containing protein [Eubacterium sp.]|nr:helix-turn-helix domain-containing protein [Eubacterium sp.]